MIFRIFLFFILNFACWVSSAHATTPEYLKLSDDDPFESQKGWINRSVHKASYEREGVRDWGRAQYLKIVSEPGFQLDLSNLEFPKVFYFNEDYAQALHISYLVWALSKSGKTVDAPIQAWLEIIIDKGKVVPQNDNYLKGGIEIAQLLLETQIQQEAEVMANLTYYFDYLDRMKAYAPEMFEVIWQSLIKHSDALLESGALAVLYPNLGVLTAPYRVPELSVLRPATVKRLRRDLNFDVQEYQSWAQSLSDESLKGFVFPFPEQIQSRQDEVRAMHWAMLIREFAQRGRSVDAPLLAWIFQLVASANEAESLPKKDSMGAWTATRIGNETARAGVVCLLIESWIMRQPSQADAVQDLLSAMSEKGLMPLSREMQNIWSWMLRSPEQQVDPMARHHVLDWAEKIAGNDRKRLSSILSGLHGWTARKKPDLKSAWPDSAYQKLLVWSRNDSPGRVSDELGVREYAWMIRMEGYGDEMPREDALSMGFWRTRALIDVYNERYLVVWLSVWGGLLCFLLARTRHGVGVMCTGVPLVALIPGCIYLAALIASIGHNNANVRGFLWVLQSCFPMYAGLVGLFCLVALASVVSRLARWSVASGNASASSAQDVDV